MQQPILQPSSDLSRSISAIILACIAETNTQGLSRIPVEKGDTANILAGGRYIDSFGLVSLLVMIEQDIEDQLGHTLNLSVSVAEAIANREHPLSTIGTLTNHILQLLGSASFVENQS